MWCSGADAELWSDQCSRGRCACLLTAGRCEVVKRDVALSTANGHHLDLFTRWSFRAFSFSFLFFVIFLSLPRKFSLWFRLVNNWVDLLSRGFIPRTRLHLHAAPSVSVRSDSASHLPAARSLAVSRHSWISARRQSAPERTLHMHPFRWDYIPIPAQRLFLEEKCAVGKETS